MLLTGWLGVVSVLLLYRPGRSNARLAALRSAESISPQARDRLHASSPLLQVCLCVLGGVSIGWVILGSLVGPPAGAVGGTALACWVSRLEPRAAVRSREAIRRNLPLAIDLWGSCSSAGGSPLEVLPIVAKAVGGPLGERLGTISARLSLGADPVAEWTRLVLDPAFGGLARAVVRSMDSGAPLAESLARLAADCRRDRRTESLAKARSVGVKAAGPLAACFLPAFMFIGVVPTVAGSFQHLFG